MEGTRPERTRLIEANSNLPSLSSELRERIERIARETYRAFCLRDYGQIDLRLRGDVPLVIDVNANPDLGTDGSFYAAAKSGGYDYPAMLDRIVRLAIERAERSAKGR